MLFRSRARDREAFPHVAAVRRLHTPPVAPSVRIEEDEMIIEDHHSLCDAPHRRCGMRIALAVALTAAFLGAAQASRAAGTSPVLLLSSADAFAGSGGERLVSASGAFNFDDLLQISFPAVGLMVVQGSNFVRYEVDGSVIAGSSPLVSNGVTLGELPSVLALGGSGQSPARLVHLNRDEVTVVLPATFAAGPASVLLYAEHGGEFFESNPLAVSVP